MTHSIFISYRRVDAGGHAGRLFDRLKQWFDADDVFYDLEGIDTGDTFPQRIRDAVDAASVVLVVIGSDWLTVLNERVTGPGVDYVQVEVAQALARHASNPAVAVLPVQMGGAEMPSAVGFHADMRADLEPLCTLNAHRFEGNQSDWDSQFVRLLTRLASFEGVPAPRYRAPSSVEQPYRLIDHALSAHFQDPERVLPRLRESLTQQCITPAVTRAALFGMGGIGKTQLALKYSQDFRDHYAGVWWFRAEANDTLQLDAKECCEKVHATIGNGELATRALKRWLDHQANTWLIVYDNAEDALALRPHLPEGARHHVLITSRNPAWGGIADAIELAVWTPEQGADFLEQRLPNGNRTELIELSFDLDGLPIALEQAASYLEATGMDVTEYRSLLANMDTAAEILSVGQATTGYERPVIATLSLAFERLSPAAQRLLSLCAFAAPEPVPERFFQEAAEQLPESLTDVATNPLAWNNVIGELRRYGIVSRIDIPALGYQPGDETGAKERALSLHRLTQAVTRSRLAEWNTDCRSFQVLLSVCAPLDAELPVHWSRYASLTPHVLQLERFLEAGALDMHQVSLLFDRVAHYLAHGSSLYADAIRVFHKAVDISIQEHNEEHPHTLSIMNNLANSLRQQGNYTSARELEEQVLEVRRRIQGEEHPGTLICKSNLASSLREQGNYACARELEEHVLEVRCRVLGNEHPDTLTCKNNLATTLRQQGDYASARKLEEEVLEVRCRVLGRDHPHTLKSMSNLASTLSVQDDHAGARELEEHVLEVRCRVLGNEHPDTLTCKNMLATTLRQQGDYAGALELEKEVLEARRRVQGRDHPDTLYSMCGLATTCRQQGDYAAALELEEQVLAATRRVLGEEHPHTLNSMNNRAFGLWHSGERDNSLRLMQEAVVGRRKILGDNHPSTMESQYSLTQMRIAVAQGE